MTIHLRLIWHDDLGGEKIAQIMNNYRLVDRIGDGGFSQVFLALRVSDGEHCAVKVGREVVGNETGSSNETRRLLMFKNVKYIVTLLDTFTATMDDSRSYEINVFEFLPHTLLDIMSETQNETFGCDHRPSDDYDCTEIAETFNEASYNDHISSLSLHSSFLVSKRQEQTGRSYRGMTLRQITHILKEILLGLAWLHHNHVIHRDIKPSNVLCSENLERIKICDLGLAIEKQCIGRAVEGTPLYMAPEQVLLEEYDESVDIWALGCIAHELIELKPMFDSPNFFRYFLDPGVFLG
ncbi:MAG: hypothetical protein MHMPM18_000253 [Marteilia pararefringens]